MDGSLIRRIPFSYMDEEKVIDVNVVDYLLVLLSCRIYHIPFLEEPPSLIVNFYVIFID